jgi:hypothetical protein
MNTNPGVSVPASSGISPGDPEKHLLAKRSWNVYHLAIEVAGLYVLANRGSYEWPVGSPPSSATQT